MNIIKLANKLDSQGQIKIADQIDNCIFCIAESNNIQNIYKQSSKLQKLLKNIDSNQSKQVYNKIIIAGDGSFAKGLLRDLGKSITSPFTNFYYDKKQSDIINNIKNILKQNQKNISNPIQFAKVIKKNTTQLLNVLKKKYQYVQHYDVEQQKQQSQIPQNKFISPPSDQQKLDLGGDIKNQQKTMNTNHWTSKPSSQQKLNFNMALPPIKIQPQSIDAKFIHEIKNNTIEYNKQNLIKHLDTSKVSPELIQLCANSKDPQIYAAAARYLSRNAQTKSSKNNTDFKIAQSIGPQAFIQDWIKIKNYCENVIQTGNENQAKKLFNSVAVVIQGMNEKNQKNQNTNIEKNIKKDTDGTLYTIISKQKWDKQQDDILKLLNKIYIVSSHQLQQSSRNTIGKRTSDCIYQSVYSYISENGKVSQNTLKSDVYVCLFNKHKTGLIFSKGTLTASIDDGIRALLNILGGTESIKISTSVLDNGFNFVKGESYYEKMKKT